MLNVEFLVLCCVIMHSEVMLSIIAMNVIAPEEEEERKDARLGHHNVCNSFFLNFLGRCLVVLSARHFVNLPFCQQNKFLVGKEYNKLPHIE